jgi:hypothetical protein
MTRHGAGCECCGGACAWEPREEEAFTTMRDPTRLGVCNRCHADFYGPECPYCEAARRISEAEEVAAEERINRKPWG